MIKSTVISSYNNIGLLKMSHTPNTYPYTPPNTNKGVVINIRGSICG